MLRVMNNNFHFVNQIKKYTFSQYETKFREIGTFKVMARLEKDNLYLFNKKEQYYIVFDQYTIGKIDKVTKDSDSEYSKIIEITGRLAPFIFTQRAINKTINFKGNSVEYIRTLIEKCFDLDDTTSKRYVRMNITTDNVPNNASLTQIDTQVTGGYLWDEMKEQLENDKLGVIVYPNIVAPYELDGQKTNIRLWSVIISSGVDRRIKNEQGNKEVIFSQQLSNINRTTYERDVEKFRNVAYVAGEGEAEERKWFELNINSDESINNKGLNRFELWIDARDIQSEDSEGNKLTTEEYENEIRKRAKEKALENNISETYSTTVRDEKYQFRKDYNIGDIVTIRDTELNVIVDAQIVGVTVSEQDSSKIIDIELEYGLVKKDVQENIEEVVKKVENAEANIKYLDEKMKSTKTIIKQGTFVFRGINGSSVLLFTRQDLDTKFGVKSDNTSNYCVTVSNGDGNANNAHIDDATWNGDKCYATLDRSLKRSNMRINFMVAYTPTTNIWKNY